MSIKKLMGAKGSRITAECFNSYNRKITHARTLKRKLWVVPCVNIPKIDMDSIREFIITSDMLTELPDFMDLVSNMMVDQCVSQKKLGPGVTEFEVTLSDVSQFQPAPDVSNVSADVGLPSPVSVEVVLRESPSLNVVLPSASTAGTPSRRTLEREASVPDDDAAEHIALDTKDAFDRGDLVSSNKLAAKSVEFWVQAMYMHLLYLYRKFTGEPAQFVDQLDSYVNLYWKFICTRLLQVSNWDAAVRIGAILRLV